MFSIILGLMLMSIGLVVAGKNSITQESTHARVIASTTSSIDKFVFRLKGCSIVHKLNDATALRCPAGVAAGLKNVKEDRIFHIVDSEADEQIGADQVWEMDPSITGDGIIVAVLDSGVDTDHPELIGDIVGCESFVAGTTCEDDNGHGTHVSGIITANEGNAKGVAPGAKIYMYKVCDASGSCYESDMMAGMEAAVETDAEVMSISIGGGNFAGEDCDSDPLAAKVNDVVSNGITVVVASGNERNYVSSPACASGAIAVGAVDKTNLMADFSNFGPALDIVAPGVNIYSSLPNSQVTLTNQYGLTYGTLSGTSMATPHVSGVIALMLQANPSLTDNEIKTALYETANPISDSVCYGVTRTRGRRTTIGVVPCTSDNYGAGIVNAFGAVNYFTPAKPECTMDDNRDCGESNIGECEYGTQTCSEEGFWEKCVDAIYPTDEICDGLDNDCDGIVDSMTQDCSLQLGVCEGTTQTCTIGMWSTCNYGPYYEEPEVSCDNLDNDCDGIVDEGCEPTVVCGDGYCEGTALGEDCNTCSADCPSRTTGKPSGRYCCGNDVCETVGEDADNCPIDCP